MSVKLDIFNDIHSRIHSQVAAIKEVYIWNGQIEAESEEQAKAYPLVYVEFSSMNWDSTSLKPVRIGTKGNYKNEQKGTFVVTLHVVFWKLTDETTAFADIDATIELVMFAILGLGATATYYTPLLRISERQDTSHDNIIDWQIDFNCGVSQCTQADTSVLIPGATLAVTVTSTIDIDNDIIRAGYEP
jgi:hypothetical protein